MGEEKDVGWDGGWGEMVDHGHDLGEYMLTAPHPYDRDDGYIPPPRWETRHELISRPFADPASMMDEGLTVDFDPAGGRPPISPTSAKGKAKRKRTPPPVTATQARDELARRKRNRAARKRPGGIVVPVVPSLNHVASMSKHDLQRIAGSAPTAAPAKPGRPPRSPIASLQPEGPSGVSGQQPEGVVTGRVQARAANTARRLGMSTEQVLMVVRGKGSRGHLAQNLGWDVAQVKRVQEAYAHQVRASNAPSTRPVAKRASPRTPAVKPRMSRPAPESFAKPLWVAGKAPTTTCASCGVAINVNGGCRCS
ncbi:hypothetical protein HC251_15985 [Iamia sp. SCSIO 61187]|uniref:hypothetical protein n=1 Tax=Iamia sp. SCSIO 61187 TaxID=2722752 RepID=UPI001C62BB59|nr:hypothetical protein [Iamia sp. SCSIO 61187]QYG93776.1 hypothetical protein HC251_15985 [Iamia sp. SCSIO 61187]